MAENVVELQSRAEERFEKAPGPLAQLANVEDPLGLRFKLAREAQRVWAAIPLAERAEKLTLAADALFAREEAVVCLIQEENGKRRVEAIGHEVTGSVATIRWLCEKGVRALEEEAVGIPWLPHRKASLARRPWGVVLVISPWNFPLSIPLSQVMAGLLAGNAVLLKPSEVTPRIGGLIEELLEPCELPSNLFAVMQGDGRMGAALIERRPDKIFFTGSLATGRKVMEAASRHPVPVNLELGGVDALIVLEDADIELASSAAAWGGFFNGGQVCASVERVLVAEPIHDVFVRRLMDKAEALEPASDLGSVTADKQLDVYGRHLADANARGLKPLSGGHFVSPRVLAPTVIAGTGVEETLAYQEESFGPIIAVRSFRHDENAVEMHNALWGGLTASVFSASAERARAVAEALDAGLVSINDVAATLYAAPELPWGGVGASGFGRSHGVEGVLEFTWSRVIEESRHPELDFKRPWWFPYHAAQADMMSALGRVIGERHLPSRLRALGDLARATLSVLKRTRT